LNDTPTLHSLAKKVEQRQFQRPIGGNGMAGNPQALAGCPKSCVMGTQFFQVLFASSGRINEEGFSRFGIFEDGCIAKIEA
jgi:hypothetical protein